MKPLFIFVFSFLAATAIATGSDDRDLQRVLQVTQNTNPLTANRTYKHAYTHLIQMLLYPLTSSFDPNLPCCSCVVLSVEPIRSSECHARKRGTSAWERKRGTSAWERKRGTFAWERKRGTSSHPSPYLSRQIGGNLPARKLSRSRDCFV